jgi:hypothetical protein
VPEALYMTSDVATAILQAAVAAGRSGASGGDKGPLLARLLGGARRGGPPPLGEVDGLSRLALLLAHERGRGAASAWAPYIASLPADPPCAWHMAPARLAAALDGLAAARGGGGGSDGGGGGGDATLPARWAAAVEAAGRVARARAAALAGAYGAPLGVDAAGVAWAMGHVVSRCFGRGGDVALAPLVDSCNHAAGASPPFALEASGGGGVRVCVSPPGGGGLAAGQELCISYGDLEGGRETALQVFLNFGFVPAGMELTE